MIFQSQPAIPSQYLEMFLIVLAVVLFSQIFNHIFGLKMSQQLANQEKIRQLKQDLLAASDDPLEIQRLQEESVLIMKETMKKTLIPSCVRCIIFLGIFGIIGFFYAGIDFLGPGSGYFIIYFLYSIVLSLLIFAIKRLIKKVRPGEADEEPFQDIAKALQSPIMTSPNMKQRKTEILEMKRVLEEKKKRGELPPDIDIDDEIRRIIQENVEIANQKFINQGQDLNLNISKSNLNDIKKSKKSWKQKLTTTDEENDEN
ncbi:MAG: hypothetical protein ACTSWY_13365 [Promethearchaeota archaeon]